MSKIDLRVLKMSKFAYLVAKNVLDLRYSASSRDYSNQFSTSTALHIKQHPSMPRWTTRAVSSFVPDQDEG